jgi:hypothetical protein
MDESLAGHKRLRDSVWLAFAEWVVSGDTVRRRHRSPHARQQNALFVPARLGVITASRLAVETGGFCAHTAGRMIGFAAGLVTQGFEMFVSQPLLAPWIGSMPRSVRPFQPGRELEGDAFVHRCSLHPGRVGLHLVRGRNPARHWLPMP